MPLPALLLWQSLYPYFRLLPSSQSPQDYRNTFQYLHPYLSRAKYCKLRGGTRGWSGQGIRQSPWIRISLSHPLAEKNCIHPEILWTSSLWMNSGHPEKKSAWKHPRFVKDTYRYFFESHSKRSKCGMKRLYQSHGITRLIDGWGRAYIQLSHKIWKVSVNEGPIPRNFL